MRGIIKGFQTVDYQKKGTNERVQGVILAMTYKSAKFYGEAVKEEFISINSPFYPEISRYLSNDVDSLVGADVFIDIVTEKRGSYTFTDITDLAITPVTKQDKKAG